MSAGPTETLASPRPEANAAGTRLFIALILLYFVAAVGLAMRLPPHATPNELLNFEYVQVMRQIKTLPNRGLVDSEVRYTEWHQPPVYFTFAAVVGAGVPVPPSETNPPPPIKWPANPAYLATHAGNLNPVLHITPRNTPLLYTSRFAAALLGVLGLAALFRAGRAVYSAGTALLMASILAFQPNYLHLSASVNNDMPLTAVAAMVLAYTILLIHNDRPPKWYFALGLLAAAAILTKANGVFVLAYLGAAWLVLLLRHRDLPRTLRSALATLAGLLPLWAAWLVLNTIRMRDTLGVEGSLPVDRVLALSPSDFALLVPWLSLIWRSFWLDWSSGDVGFGPRWYYWLWALCLAAALLGWLRRPAPRGKLPVTLAVVLGALAITYLYFAVKALTVKEAGTLVPEGRWWLPVMPAVAWLAGAGFARWWSPQRRERAVLLAAAVPFVSTYLLLFLFYPLLYPQARLLASTEPWDQESAVLYDGRLALLDVQGAALVAGEEGQVTMTWQALADIEQDLTVAAQLLAPHNGGWRKLDEQNSYPGLGLSPTSDWAAGERYQDTWLLRPARILDGPTLAQLAIQVQGEDGNVPAYVNGQRVDPPFVFTVPVRPAEPLAVSDPLTEQVLFGDGVQLAGIEVQKEGDDWLLTLWWEALHDQDQDLAVFVHALDSAGQLVAQDDSPPAGGASPTSIWREGDVIRDEHRLAGAPGAQSLLIGLYAPASGRRLAAVVDGHATSDHAYRVALPGD